MSSNIIKGKPSTHETIVLIGNGAVENGWYPLRKILDKMIEGGRQDPKIQNIQKSNLETFNQLAVISYKFRTFKAHAYTSWKRSNTSLTGKIIEQMDSILKKFVQLRFAISNEYSNSHLKLRWSKKIEEEIGNDACFLTTNWDNAAWTDEKVSHLIHLHGRCNIPETIVFPTELVIEEALFNLDDIKIDASSIEKDHHQLLSEIFRQSELRNLLAAHAEASSALKNAKKIIIWGYALADYDADINTLLATYANSQAELLVINIEQAAFRRAIALTQCLKARLFNPITDQVVEL